MTIAAGYGTISDIEILWVLIAAIGCCFTLLNLRAAHGDVEWVASAKIFNGRRFLAKATFRMELIRLVIQVLYLTIGGLAMTLPDPPAFEPIQATITGALIRWGLIVSSALLTYKTYLARQVRQQLLEE